MLSVIRSFPFSSSSIADLNIAISDPYPHLSNVRRIISRQTASRYGRIVIRPYSVSSVSPSGTSSTVNLKPQSDTSLYDILKEEFKGRKGLGALQESGLTWSKVESIKMSVDNDMDKFEGKMKKTLKDVGLNLGDAFDFAVYLTVKAFPPQTVIQNVTDFLNNLPAIFDPPTSSSLRVNPLTILKPMVSCSLFGRDEEMNDAIDHINLYVIRRHSKGEHPCFMFTGSSGCGKTRMLFQIAMMSLIHNGQEEEVRKFLEMEKLTEPAINNIISQSKGHVASLKVDPFKVVGISFKGVMDIDDNYEADLMKNNLEVSVCLRLIYSTYYDHLTWKNFLKTIFTRFDKSSLSRVLRFPELSRAMFPRHDRSPLVLILFDELLRPTYEHGTSADEIKCLMSTIHQTIDRLDSNVYGIVWSAMFDASIVKYRGPTGRCYLTRPLKLLNRESMESIMKSRYETDEKFHNSVKKIRKYSIEEIVAKLSGMCGGLSGSIDLMIEAFENLQQPNFAEIYRETARIHGERYQPTLDIIKMAFTKYMVPEDYAIGTSTALDEANKGSFHVVENDDTWKTMMPQVSELSLAACGFMKPNDEFSQDMIKCFYEFFNLRLYSTNNVFEEVLRRREILLHHLRNKEEYASIHPFQLFHPFKACLNHNPDLRVVGNIKLNSNVKVFDALPSPEFDDAENYLFSPKNPLESGMDWLLIFPKCSDRAKRVAVGVHCEVASTEVELEVLIEANKNFTNTMVNVGWDADDLYNVFIIDGETCNHMNSPPGTYLDKLMSSQWKNIAIVSNDDNRLKQMLGTTVYSFFKTLEGGSKKRSGIKFQF